MLWDSSFYYYKCISDALIEGIKDKLLKIDGLDQLKVMTKK